MKNQISKNPVKKARKEKRIKKLKKEGLIVKGVEIPKGVLPANPDNQAYSGGYAAKLYYSDIHYTCAGCSKKEVWTAPQQKRYFETQKGNIYNEPKWCHKCHLKRMRDKEEKSKINA